MPVMTNSLTANGGTFAPTPSSSIANIQDGGQLGFGPLLPNLDANTPSVYLPLQFVVTHVPTIFSYINNGPAIFKSLFETHMVSMDGLDFNYSMETDGTPVGRDGQQQMVPTRQVRSQISPTCTWSEKIGNVVYNMGRVWMNNMRDPDTQASSMAGIVSSGTTLPPLVASMYAADIMAIQYDTTYRPENIIDAFFMTNFFPTELGGSMYGYNAVEAHRPDRTFTFTCIVQHNANTVAVAQSLATLMNLHEVNYQDALPVAQSIDSTLANEGEAYLASEYMANFTNLSGTVTTTT